MRKAVAAAGQYGAQVLNQLAFLRHLLGRGAGSAASGEQQVGAVAGGLALPLALPDAAGPFGGEHMRMVIEAAVAGEGKESEEGHEDVDGGEEEAVIGEDAALAAAVAAVVARTSRAVLLGGPVVSPTGGVEQQWSAGVSSLSAGAAASLQLLVPPLSTAGQQQATDALGGSRVPSPLGSAASSGEVGLGLGLGLALKLMQSVGSGGGVCRARAASRAASRSRSSSRW